MWAHGSDLWHVCDGAEPEETLESETHMMLAGSWTGTQDVVQTVMGLSQL